MNIFRYYIPSLILSISFISANAQVEHNHFCKNNEILKAKLGANYKAKVDSVIQVQKLHKAAMLNDASRSQNVYYIPVVYHILHQGGPEKISYDQVYDDIEQLNILMRKQNPSANLTDPSFRNLASDIQVEFRLAQKKDDGSCFSGITHTFSGATNTGGNSAVNAVINAHGYFPGNKYLNIFVCKDLGGAAGYTGFPFDNNMDNGIFVLHNYVGRIGTSVQTNENATMAHELGHWLNLPHLWGYTNQPGIASNCNSDDGIGDTPNTIGWTSCSVGSSSCGTRDNVENIMEYSYCSNHMFTVDQKNQMRAAITGFTAGRNNVISASNHAATGIFTNVLCEADFNAERTVTCAGQPLQFNDASYHKATSWNWSFTGGTPSSSSSQNPIVTYNSPGIYSVQLTATNSTGSNSTTKTQYIKVIPSTGKPTPYSEGFESINLEDDFTVSTAGNENFEITSTSSFSGSKSIRLENFNNTIGIVSEAASTSIDLSNISGASISFKYAYARKTSSSGEQANLLISKDCGQTWVVYRGLNPTVSAINSYYTPSGTGDWNTITAPISNSFSTENFRFMFKVSNGLGNNMYIDDINLSGTVSINEIDELTDFSIYPNPFNETAKISLTLNSTETVNIDLLSVTGRKIKDIVSNEQIIANNTHEIVINKEALSKGVYLVRMSINGKQQIERIVIN